MIEKSMNKELNLSERQVNLIVWTLLSIMPIIGMIVDLIAPSLPAMTTELHISEAFVKNIITMYLFGYALGNFLTGFISDAYGRRKLIRIALLGFIIASALPIISNHISILIFSRFLQGITIGAAAVLLRAIFADILPQEKLIRLGAILGTMWGLGPIIGPIIGSYLQVLYGWEACFYFFTFIGLISFIAVYLIIPETHHNRQPLTYTTIKRNCKEILSNKVFIALPILMGVAYSFIITFHTSGPFLIQDILHYSPIFFGRMALCMGISFLISTFTAKYLLTKMSVERIFQFSLTFFLSAIILLLIIGYVSGNQLWIIIISSLIMFFASGILFPLSMGKGLSMFSHLAGTATALMYLINGSITGGASFIMSLLSVKNATSLVWIYLFLILICITIYRFLIHKPINN